MMGIKIVFCLVVLTATGTEVGGDDTGAKYYLYKSGVCAHNGGTVIDLSDVPHGGWVHVLMNDDGNTAANCSLAFTYNDATTPTLFLAQSTRWLYLGPNTCLTLYDGKDSTASTKLQKCGYYYDQTVFLTTGNSILFSVDTSTQNITHGTKFFYTLLPFPAEANYFMEDLCSPTEDTLVQPNKTIWLHTNRGNQYQDNEDCSMTLYTDTDYRLLVRFHTLSLEYSDCLTFYDARVPDGIIIKEMCGSGEPTELETYGRYLTVNFTTDSQNVDLGAIMVITSTSEEWECPYSEEFKCEGYPECYSPVDICNGIYDCPDRIDETNCTSCFTVECDTSPVDDVCIPWRNMCDGVSDCIHNEDENDDRCDCNTVLCRTFLGYECLDEYSICDSLLHCIVSAADENPELCNCETGVRCRTNSGYECLDENSLCDSTTDCNNGVDENPKLCDCGTGFRCLTNSGYECMDETSLCDSSTDCINSADESPQLCECDTGVRCLTNSGYECLDENSLCDSTTDCINGVDESPQLCDAATRLGPPLQILVLFQALATILVYRIK